MRIPPLLLAIVIGLQSLLLAQARERPLSFISDPSHLLPRETRDSLESFLRARSNDLQTEIFVLLDPIPASSPTEAKLRVEELGNSWSKHNWAIIYYRPKQVGAPMVVTGGPFLNDIVLKSWEHELSTIQELSLQSWHSKTDIDFLARRVADSIAFTSRFKSATTQSLAKNRNEQFRKEYRSQKTQKVYLITITLASILPLGITAFFIRKVYLAKRKLYFPETTWSSRLGGPHSGGSAVNHLFTPPQV